MACFFAHIHIKSCSTRAQHLAADGTALDLKDRIEASDDRRVVSQAK